MRDKIAYGGLDSAMWVSGSEEVRVIDTVTYAAPIGLQVNVSKVIEVERIRATGNVTGIALTHPLASGLGDDVDLAFGYRSESVRFAESEVYDNNLVNPVSTGSVGGDQRQLLLPVALLRPDPYRAGPVASTSLLPRGRRPKEARRQEESARMRVVN